METAAMQAKSSSDGVHCITLVGRKGIEAVASQWAELWERAECDIPFCHPDWIQPYVSAFGANRELLTLAAMDGDTLLGILPLIRETTRQRGLPVRVLHSTTNPHAPHFDLLRAPGPQGDEAARTVLNGLMACPGWDVVDIQVVPSPTAELLRTAAEEHRCAFTITESPSICVPLSRFSSNPLKWQADMSSHARHELRRHRRKLEAAIDGKTIALVRTDATDRKLMQDFYRIEASGWKGADGTGTAISCAENTRCFYDEIAERFTRLGLFELYALTVDDEPIAMMYAILAHNRMSMLKIGYLNEYGNFAPGQLMFDEIFKVFWERGIAEADFGPDGEYKRRWTSNVVPRFNCRIYNSTVYARSLYALETRVKPAVKAILSQSRPTEPAHHS